MLLSITNTGKPANDLGYLLHKNPFRCQVTSFSVGKAYVFYPEVTESRCTASLLLDIDPVDMVRGKVGSLSSGPLGQYVNDRPIAKIISVQLNVITRLIENLSSTPTNRDSQNPPNMPT